MKDKFQTEMQLEKMESDGFVLNCLIGNVSKCDQTYLSQMTDSTQTMAVNLIFRMYLRKQNKTNTNNRDCYKLDINRLVTIAFMVKHFNFTYILLICHKH